ncbi:MATE family efflux transporter [Flavonifractor hominis]|uniref:MATE family efflux transporter n=1 Tax=Flavonifractor hominis TaxID=3133178 RepID=A0ABV1EP42_9FIRM
MDRSDQNRLTEGSVPRKMLLFALPIFLSNLFQQLYNAVDSLIVGNFIGSSALAAVGSSGSLILLLIGFINGVSLGAGVLIARFFGAGDEKNLERAVHTTVALGLVSGVVLTVVGVLLTPQILRWIGTPADVIENSILYFRVYFLGSSAVVLYNMGASILQSVGDSRSPMKYLIFSSVVNVVLDLLFVAVFHWGIASAALATIISQAVSAFLAFRKLTLTRHSYRVCWRRVRFDGDMFRQVITLGVPSGVQSSVISLANVIVQANINAFGSSAMAGCGAYSKVEGFAFLPVTCFALALSTFVSQNIGAKRYDRVREGMRFGLLCSPLLAEGIGLIIFALAPVLISAFNSEPEVLAFGVADARTVALFYCLLAFSHCCAGILRGMGRPIVPMTIMLSVWCVLRITYITITVRLIPDIHVVYWAYPITWSISSLLFLLCLRRLHFPAMEEEHTL